MKIDKKCLPFLTLYSKNSIMNMQKERLCCSAQFDYCKIFTITALVATGRLFLYAVYDSE